MSSDILHIVESYADGDFDTLFNMSWTSVESFISAAYDYIPSKTDRDAFASRVREAATREEWHRPAKPSR